MRPINPQSHWFEEGDDKVGDAQRNKGNEGNKSVRHHLRTSHRSRKLESYAMRTGEGSRQVSRAGVNVFPVAIGISGFVLQFEGLRLVNWTCSIAQLVATCIMPSLRAVARRGLIGKPVARMLTQGRELDFVAMNIAGNGGIPCTEQYDLYT